MSLAKVIEVLAEGKTIEEAFENAVAEASQTVDSIKSVWASDVEAKVENGEIQSYRITAKITFTVNKL
ncbi:MAG TPA: dodecin family protein [Fodinibius sp.]|nr:dodecin family protein [Fodinibius sp.]